MTENRPFWQTMKDCLDDLPSIFTVKQMMASVRQQQPDIDGRRIRRFLRYMSVNNHNRKSSVPDNILFKIDASTYRRYDVEHDGPYDSSDSDDYEGEPGVGEPTEETLEFALELHLEDFIEANWDRIDFGRRLRLYQTADDMNGRQFHTEIGTIDFLCEDISSGDLVVVELKKGRSSDKVLGQCQRYMGWVKASLAREDQSVRGLIIAPEVDERLRYALTVAPNVDMRCYRVDFQLVDPSAEDPSDD